jgi:hypothetical protein
MKFLFYTTFIFGYGPKIYKVLKNYHNKHSNTLNSLDFYSQSISRFIFGKLRYMNKIENRET